MPTLSKLQLADCFKLTKDSGLDPVDFHWTIDKVEGGDKGDNILHRPTGSHFRFEFGQSTGYWLVHWPGLGNQQSRYEAADTWYAAVLKFNEWLTRVRRDHEAPDVWGEISKQAAIPDAATGDHNEKTFSVSEVKLLRAGLEQIERYVIATQPPLPPDEVAEVGRRFQYLNQAATTSTRKIDWLNIFVGQMVGMVTAGLMSPTVYQPVMAHAATVLQAVFQFGLKLLP